MDWQTIVTIFGMLLAGGGLAGIIRAVSLSDRSSLDGCMILVKEQRERINTLESTMAGLNTKVFDMASERRAEETGYIKQIALLQLKVEQFKDKLDDADTQIIRLTNDLGITNEKLAKANEEINRLKKKLKLYEENVN